MCTFLTFFYDNAFPQLWSLHLCKSTAQSFVLSSILWFFFSSILCLFLCIVSIFDNHTTRQRKPDFASPPCCCHAFQFLAKCKSAGILSGRALKLSVHQFSGVHLYAKASDQCYHIRSYTKNVSSRSSCDRKT